MNDKYYVYRPLLDLIAKTEGTGPHDNYNETLNYGAYTGGDVSLVTMTLAQIDALQTKMLKHPKNKLRSSAVGRYQIIRTTLREIKDQLRLSDNALYDEEMQDRLACFLLGRRGIDKWLSGRMSLTTLITNLAQEWASLPNNNGSGFYAGQRASTTVQQLVNVLEQVRNRHLEGAPVRVPDPGELSTHPAKSKTVWQWIIVTFIAPILSVTDDRVVQMALLAVIGLLAAYAIKRRTDLFTEAKELMDKFDGKH